jgi:hypothetical protein
MNFLNMKVLAQHHRFTWYNLPFSAALDVKIKAGFNSSEDNNCMMSTSK